VVAHGDGLSPAGMQQATVHMNREAYLIESS
jgi:hypothetical protein